MQYKIYGLLLLSIWLLSSCQRETATPIAAEATATPTTAVLATIIPSATATVAPPPSPTSVATTPIPPTIPPTATLALTFTPTPDYPLYTGTPLLAQEMGIQIHLRGENLDNIFTHLEALGVGWVKVQISWKLYEPTPDVYEAERMAELDRFIQRAHESGVAVLLGVAKAPEWSRPITEGDGPPSDYGQYHDFMQMLASRYQGRVAAYELWNEMNLQREWQGVPLQAADFVELVRMGAAGVRAADSEAILISGAPAPTGINDGVTAVDDRVYFRQMMAAGLGDAVDAIGAHPYGWANPPDATVANPDPAIPSHNNHPSFFFRDTLQEYRTLLNEAGHNDLPLWVTEFGWGSFEGFGGVPPAGVEFMTAVSEWQQATYTLRAFELGQADPTIGPMILWNLNFGPLLGEEFSESGFSLLRHDGTPRPVYKGLAATLANN